MTNCWPKGSRFARPAFCYFSVVNGADKVKNFVLNGALMLRLNSGQARRIFKGLLLIKPRQHMMGDTRHAQNIIEKTNLMPCELGKSGAFWRIGAVSKMGCAECQAYISGACI